MHNDQTLLDAGIKIANTTLALFVTADGVLQEAEVISSEDGALFKGIFMRNLGRFASVLASSASSDGNGGNGGGNGGDALHAYYTQFIKRSVASATTHAMLPDTFMFASDWQGPVDASSPGCKQGGQVLVPK